MRHRATTSERHESLLRQVVEFFACLAIAVLVFKTFEAEGYMISTGSMAPTLLGRHKHATCPSCKYEFAVGATPGHAPEFAVCPNCGLSGISLTSLPTDDGDQLLVHKTAFDLRQPRRWETVVFRNPQKPREAYVKRIAGLPGEHLEIQRGDVYVEGRVQTKPLATQRAMRILVFDQDFAPKDDDPDWQPRWTGEAGWESRGKGFVVDTRFDNESGDKIAWLNYRHWIRSGGDHVTQVKAPPPPGSADLTGISGMPLWYDADHRTLCCRGALTTAEQDDLLGKSEDGAFRDAVERLYAQSHIAPITDSYGYNRAGPGQGGGQVVRDLMIALTLGYESGNGDFRVELTDGAQRYACVFDFPRSELRLEREGDHEPLRTATLSAAALERPLKVEFSWMDHQLLVALDGRLAFEPWQDSTETVPDEVPLLPVRLGANGVKLYVANLRLYRDIYYTEPEDQPAHAGWTLSDEPGRREYFMLGDNSPVSVDSRFWPRNKAVTEAAWLGKPFLVHLPARTRPVRIAGREAQIRIPDPARIRYIR